MGPSHRCHVCALNTISIVHVIYRSKFRFALKGAPPRDNALRHPLPKEAAPPPPKMAGAPPKGKGKRPLHQPYAPPSTPSFQECATLLSSILTWFETEQRYEDTYGCPSASGHAYRGHLSNLTSDERENNVLSLHQLQQRIHQHPDLAESAPADLLPTLLALAGPSFTATSTARRVRARHKLPSSSRDPGGVG